MVRGLLDLPYCLYFAHLCTLSTEILGTEVSVLCSQFDVCMLLGQLDSFVLLHSLSRVAEFVMTGGIREKL